MLRLASDHPVAILDSSGVGHLGSHLLIAGVEPVERLEMASDDPGKTLTRLDDKLAGDKAAIFTISYDFGKKLLGIKSRKKESASFPEADIYLALFDALVLHDYDSGETKFVGNSDKFDSITSRLAQPREKTRVLTSVDRSSSARSSTLTLPPETLTSNFTKAEYLSAIERIKEHIRDGETYQTNLTQQLSARLPDGLTPEIIFSRLRRDHPAPFSAYIKRADSTVVSASPERFFCVRSPHVDQNGHFTIQTSPIKGTTRRGSTADEDARLRDELLTSSKDRAENTMIVDLLRNDLGRVCEFGSVRVDKLCDLEEHPTLFHLVSTISGGLSDDLKFTDILKAVFPCGSITGAPKISTMNIIDEIETADRGLSMGAIGYYVPATWGAGLAAYDLSVAIRTMVIRDDLASFNVGGGITIDSDPETEYDETMLKARALLNSLGRAGTI